MGLRKMLITDARTQHWYTREGDPDVTTQAREERMAEQTLRVWSPIMLSIGGIVVAVGVSWGMMQTQLTRAVSEQSTVAQTVQAIQISIVEMKASQGRIETKMDSAVATVGVRVAAVEKELAALTSYVNTAWPRLRNNAENIVILHRELERLCSCVIPLRAPEKF